MPDSLHIERFRNQRLRRFGIAAEVGLHAKPYHYVAKIRLLMLRVGKDVPDIPRGQMRKSRFASPVGGVDGLEDVDDTSFLLCCKMMHAREPRTWLSPDKTRKQHDL